MVPPQPNSPSSVCGASTSARRPAVDHAGRSAAGGTGREVASGDQGHADPGGRVFEEGIVKERAGDQRARTPPPASAAARDRRPGAGRRRSRRPAPGAYSSRPSGPMLGDHGHRRGVRRRAGQPERVRGAGQRGPGESAQAGAQQRVVLDHPLAQPDQVQAVGGDAGWRCCRAGRRRASPAPTTAAATASPIVTRRGHSAEPSATTPTASASRAGLRVGEVHGRRTARPCRPPAPG